MPVVKVLEIVGESGESFGDAVVKGVRELAARIPSIAGVEVLNWTANVKDGQIVKYKANMKVAYLDEEP
ncbi:MAG: dodecin family protein [Bacillota bacterium]|jgi:flavin-binding protein dodecin|nr:dodecin domain-containing protein [Candidatus Fermentithermobacillaceae bacterium]